MKNGLVIWNVLLTLIAGVLLYLHFSNKTPKSSSKVVGPTATGASTNDNASRIAYFEMDSIEAHYDMVKDVQAEIETKQKDYSNSLSQLDATYNNKINEYRNKQATMTQDDYQKAQLSLKNLEDALRGKKQELDQGMQEFQARKMLALKKEIEEFIAKYNQSKSYAYIMAYEPGLFYYKDTAYNITPDVIKGLNMEYKLKKK